MVHAPILPEGVLQLESERKVRRREERKAIGIGPMALNPRRQ